MTAFPSMSENIMITVQLIPVLTIGSLQGTITESQRYITLSLTQIKPSAKNIMNLLKPAVLRRLERWRVCWQCTILRSHYSLPNKIFHLPCTYRQDKACSGCTMNKDQRGFFFFFHKIQLNAFITLS